MDGHDVIDPARLRVNDPVAEQSKFPVPRSIVDSLDPTHRLTLPLAP